MFVVVDDRMVTFEDSRSSSKTVRAGCDTYQSPTCRPPSHFACCNRRFGESGSAGKTRTYNQWINSPAHPVRPVPVGDVWCCPVYEFRSVMLSDDVLSWYVRLHIWLHMDDQ